MTPTNISEELKVAIEAAKIGAKEALKYFDKDIKIEYKSSDHTPVTIADKNSEKAIKQEILKSFPKAKFVGEETGGNFDEDEFWIIDPIDGTRSFIHGIFNWCVIISLCKTKQIILTVLYYPSDDSVFWSMKGHGAYLNKKRLFVSKIKNLDKAFLGFGSLRYFKDKQLVMDLVDATESSRGYDPTFSSCMVSCGKMDINVDAFGKIWDIAPFKLLIEEAGGKITRMDGSEWKPDKRQGCIISNGLLHDKVVSIVNKRR